MTTRAFVRDERWLAAAVDAASEGLSLAAAPVFALMAAVAATGPHDMLCAVGARPMNGMAWMYALMSIRHAGVWLKLLSNAFRST
jgi:hypothetical protein